MNFRLLADGEFRIGHGIISLLGLNSQAKVLQEGEFSAPTVGERAVEQHGRSSQGRVDV